MHNLGVLRILYNIICTGNNTIIKLCHIKEKKLKKNY